MGLVGKYKPGVPGAKVGKMLWELLPQSLKKQLYYEPRGINLAFEYATASGKPVDIDLRPHQIDLINDIISKSKESEWIPSTNVAAGRTADKGYSHKIMNKIPGGMHDILGGLTSLSRHINPATKDTNYTLVEDWDLVQGKNGKTYPSSRTFNTESIPKLLMSLMSIYEKLGYINKKPVNQWETNFGVTDKFINRGKPVPMIFPTITRKYNGDKK